MWSLECSECFDVVDDSFDNRRAHANAISFCQYFVLQHPLPIVKYQTLRLMKIALVRAAGLVGVWAEVKRSVNSSKCV